MGARIRIDNNQSDSARTCEAWVAETWNLFVAAGVSAAVAEHH